ncbi:hypothetical protein F3Y22_tig00111096pilonHSYRG00120 [Hibiscus syriacus]|uniref:SREBP regulating gene protein n=1 Tax=Hibiscus syriacus TaxID=106335 RepID=A0A6A2Z1U5_HIBSY|nr:hypothetical protein F3Y22_tig00111096pilonHSYRG00120 [Hibiscus syriacus]
MYYSPVTYPSSLTLRQVSSNADHPQLRLSASFNSESSHGESREIMVQHLLLKEDDQKLLDELQQRITRAGKEIGFLDRRICRTTVQGRYLLYDDKGYVCDALSFDPQSRCCPERGGKFSCHGRNVAMSFQDTFQLIKWQFKDANPSLTVTDSRIRHIFGKTQIRNEMGKKTQVVKQGFMICAHPTAAKLEGTFSFGM